MLLLRIKVDVLIPLKKQRVIHVGVCGEGGRAMDTNEHQDDAVHAAQAGSTSTVLGFCLETLFI